MSLPPELDCNGQWHEVRDRLYQCFSDIFLTVPLPIVQGQVLTIDGRRLDDNLEEGFWHVTSRGPVGNRQPDFDRARRLPWIPIMIDGTAPGLSRWRYQEGSGRFRQYYWLEDEHYVLILEEDARRRLTALVTAFFVDKTGAAKDLARKRASGTSF